jgi:hypothetical protein
MTCLKCFEVCSNYDCSVQTRYQVVTAKQTCPLSDESTRNNRGAVGSGVFYTVRAEGLYNEHISRAVVERGITDVRLVNNVI